MKFAIRDDDVSVDTDPEVLEGLYRGIWESLPISLGVIPFSKDTEGQEVPLEKNQRLVDLLIRNVKEKRVEIMLHGYTHEEREERAEFEGTKGLCGKVFRGKRYLESILEAKVKVFVPPHNRISPYGMRVVAKNRLNIVGTFSMNPLRTPHQINGSLILCLLSKRIFYGVSGLKIPYPYPLEFQGYKCLECLDIYKGITFPELAGTVEAVRRVKGSLCIAVHHIQLWQDLRLRNTVFRILELVRKDAGILPCRVSDLFE
jgi:hypothetical protein